MVTVEVGLESEEDQHAVHELRNGANTALAPGPDLRTDEVDDRDPEPLELAGEPQIELREVDQDGDGRPALFAGRDEEILDLPGARQDAERLRDAHDRDLTAVGDELDTLRPQLVGAEAERSQAGTQALELAQHPRAVLIP